MSEYLLLDHSIQSKDDIIDFVNTLLVVTRNQL